jgi:hypothetical protein
VTVVEARSPTPEGPEPGPDLAHELELRDRRLADLTEHCLQILDRLSAARDELRQREQWRTRIDLLEEELRATRARVRAAGTVLFVPGAPAAGVAEIVVWGVTRATGLACGQLLASAGDLPVTLIPDNGVRPAELDLPQRPGLRLLDGATATPAQALNLAMQSTEAAVVVCVRAGALPVAGTIDALAQAAAAPGIALACPVLERRGTRNLGCKETGPLQLTAAAVPATETGGSPAVAIDFADAAFLALPRAAYEALGAFDEDMTTDLAVAEWCLRARAQAWRVLGLASAVATVLVPAAADPAAMARDRLVAVARHRPAELAAVAAAAEFFWREPLATLEPTLRAAFRRALAGNQGEAAVELLVGQAAAMARGALPLPVLEQQLAASLQVIDPGLALAPGPHEAWFGQVAEALRRRLGDVERRHARAIEELNAALATQREVTNARIGQIADLESQLLQFRHDLHVAQSELQRRDAMQGELQRLLHDVAAHAGSAPPAGLPLADQVRRLGAHLDQLRATLDQLRATLEQREQWIGHLLQEVQRRRLRARPLQPHEHDFLAHRRGRP